LINIVSIDLQKIKRKPGREKSPDMEGLELKIPTWDNKQYDD